MTTITDPADLIAASDVARLLGVTRGAVSNYQQRDNDFPTPVLVVANGSTSLFSRRAVAALREVVL